MLRRRIYVPLTLLALSLAASAGELEGRLQRIFDSGAFAQKPFGPARWIRNGDSFTTLESSAATPGGRDIVEHNTATGARTVLIAAAQLKPPKADKPLTIEDYHWDRDYQRLLIFTESKRTWRTNSRGDYWLFDRKSSTLKKLGGDAPASSLLFAKFSPDGASVAYVRENNLYVEDLSSGAIRPLTTDGSPTLVNGTSDWVYEEELNLRDGFRWSPDGRSLAYWQFDLSQVPQFTLINNTDSTYPKLTTIPYPKAGSTNSSVRIGVVSTQGGPTRWMQVPGDPRQHYLFRMAWAGSGRELLIGQLNRKQNTAIVFQAEAETGAVKSIFQDQDDAWLDVPESSGAAVKVDGFDWLNPRHDFLWLSERDGWRRAYTVPRAGGAPVAVTPANMDVISIEAVDPEGKWLYFMASPDDPTQRQLYRAALDKPGPPTRITPTSQPGSHSYKISPNGQWALHTYSRFDVPPVTDLISLPNHKPTRVLAANEVLHANAAAITNPPVEWLKVPVADGVSLDGWVLKPRQFDPAKKYPLILFVYGEPWGANAVDAWAGNTTLFHRALAEAGYLVATFDNRGTPSPRGRAWRKSIYGAVGVLSTHDLTKAVLGFAEQKPYVDLSRVGVWGWSGGGSTTLNLMFRSPGVFRAGVAVAPVPDETLYDTIYQERYMGLPDENADGYRMGSPINFASGLQGHLLLVHGSGDDNVHYQGTEKLINRLIELGKSFDMMTYPNRSHGIYEGRGTSLHVYSLIARYFQSNLPAGPR
jgi:dipeptidyl-peptidase-4